MRANSSRRHCDARIRPGMFSSHDHASTTVVTGERPRQDPDGQTGRHTDRHERRARQDRPPVLEHLESVLCFAPAAQGTRLPRRPADARTFRRRRGGAHELRRAGFHDRHREEAMPVRTGACSDCISAPSRSPFPSASTTAGRRSASRCCGANGWRSTSSSATSTTAPTIVSADPKASTTRISVSAKTSATSRPIRCRSCSSS